MTILYLNCTPSAGQQERIIKQMMEAGSEAIAFSIEYGEPVVIVEPIHSHKLRKCLKQSKIRIRR